MAVKVFLLGRPGSGKSTAARSIERQVRREGLSAIRINDYRILYDMFQKEKNQSKSGPKQFSCAEHKGFDVIDFSILDTVLREVERKVKKQICFGKNEFILIEFARDDYIEALKKIDSRLLQSAYFLFFDAEINTCILRIYQRTLLASKEDEFLDNHFVSEKIIRDYYHKDNTPPLIAQLIQAYR
jgi:adenylate kinase family enzyme